MFLKNKYTVWYLNIIQNAKQNDNNYHEKHHIIPKCMGGSDSADNIVKLTAKEHFVCHLLLIKMVEKTYKSKLIYAAWQQSRSAKFKTKISSRQYENLKKALSESYKGRKRKPFTEKTKTNMSLAKIGDKNNMYNRRHTEETKKQISQNRKGKLCGEDNPFFGKTHSREVINKIAIKSSEKQKGISKPKSPCPKCGMFVAANIMKRYHGDNCKRSNLP